jgi:predicted phage terminase large subunit-like protein
MRLWKYAMTEPGLYGMYAPTYPLLRDTIQRVFLDLASEHVSERRLSEGVIVMQSGSEILCRSLDDPEHARGPSLRGAVVDEASLCIEDAFNILIGCLRYEGKQGWLAATFTPKGKQHWTAKVFNDPDRCDVRCFHARTDDNPFNPPEFRATLQRQYASVFAQQELDGSFVDFSGGMFRREHFKIIQQAPTRFQATTRAWDLASTEKSANSQDPDWTVGVKIGLLDGQYYILDMQRGRWSPGTVETMMKQTAQLDGAGTRIRQEQEGGSSGKIVVAHIARNVLQGFDYRGIPATGDKATRANPLAAAVEAGNVFLVAGAWNKAMIDELESFSPSCAHDDIVDASALAFNDLARPKASLV